MSIINTVIKGKQPSGTITITSNTTTNVSDYEYAVTAVPTTAPALYREFQLDNTGKLEPNTTTTHIMDFTGVTDVESYALAQAYNNNANVTGAVNMSDLTTLSGNNACYNMFALCFGLTGVGLPALTTVSGSYACSGMFSSCSNLTSISLPALTTVSGSYACTYMFYVCSNLTSISLPALTTISGSSACSNMFNGCKKLTNVSLPALTTISGSSACSNMFNGCKKLTNVSLPALTTISGSSACSNMFNGCTSLTSLSFPALTSTSFGSYTTQFNKMLNGVTGCTVHFPSNLQPVIGSWADVVAGFGGTNTTVLFDLPATES